jgi:hypothetical protein
MDSGVQFSCEVLPKQTPIGLRDAPWLPPPDPEALTRHRGQFREADTKSGTDQHTSEEPEPRSGLARPGARGQRSGPGSGLFSVPPLGREPGLVRFPPRKGRERRPFLSMGSVRTRGNPRATCGCARTAPPSLSGGGDVFIRRCGAGAVGHGQPPPSRDVLFWQSTQKSLQSPEPSADCRSGGVRGGRL